jgi:acyl carrier protein
LYETVGAILGVSPGSISQETSPDTISAWDSLNHLNLVVGLESEFGVTLTPEQVFDMRNVRRMQTILRELGIDV